MCQCLAPKIWFNVQTQLILMLYALLWFNPVRALSRLDSQAFARRRCYRHRDNLILLHGNNKGADQPAHKRSLINPFVIQYVNLPPHNFNLILPCHYVAELAGISMTNPAYNLGPRSARHRNAIKWRFAGGPIVARFNVLTGKPRRQIFSRQGRNISDANYEHYPLVSRFTTDATLSNFSTKYLVMCKVYTDVGGIK